MAVKWNKKTLSGLGCWLLIERFVGSFLDRNHGIDNGIATYINVSGLTVNDGQKQGDIH